MIDWNEDVESVLVSESELKEIVKRLASEIENDYKDEEKVVLVGVL